MTEEVVKLLEGVTLLGLWRACAVFVVVVVLGLGEFDVCVLFQARALVIAGYGGCVLP